MEIYFVSSKFPRDPVNRIIGEDEKKNRWYLVPHLLDTINQSCHSWDVPLRLTVPGLLLITRLVFRVLAYWQQPLTPSSSPATHNVLNTPNLFYIVQPQPHQLRVRITSQIIETWRGTACTWVQTRVMSWSCSCQMWGDCEQNSNQSRLLTLTKSHVSSVKLFISHKMWILNRSQLSWWHCTAALTALTALSRYFGHLAPCIILRDFCRWKTEEKDTFFQILYEIFS